jgi:hypothetical protein
VEYQDGKIVIPDGDEEVVTILEPPITEYDFYEKEKLDSATSKD